MGWKVGNDANGTARDWFKQEKTQSCGVACAIMIVRLLQNKSVDETTVRAMFTKAEGSVNVGFDGTRNFNQTVGAEAHVAFGSARQQFPAADAVKPHRAVIGFHEAAVPPVHHHGRHRRVLDHQAVAGLAFPERGFGALPLVAIGGIHAGNAGDVLRAGADGLAVVSALCAADDPQAAASRLRALCDEEINARRTRG